ncbi:hypothetical protein OJ252_3607 [Cryptosporidium canis]|uniref:Longin domain-containing protein n=1 Tax=Cryptosporidium canis TaxID=195482 RepID=A0ABQ8P1U4_9CRYT|nr:hypothetical protein OJ252_3607 [Cryptosporidium canis]
MRAYSIFVCKEDNENYVSILSSCFSLSRFSYFERNSIKEIFKFIVKSITPKLNSGVKEIITHEEFSIFSYKWSDGLSIYMICDYDFPARVAFSSIFEIYMHINNPNTTEVSNTDEDHFIHKVIIAALNKYKDPTVSDAIIESQIKIDKARATKEIPTAPTSPSIAPLHCIELPENVIKEVSRVLYFGFGGFLATSIISLAVIQVNINAVCDRNLDEINGLSALFSLSMSLVCSLMLFLPNQRDTLIRGFKYNEFPTLNRESAWRWMGMFSFILVLTLMTIHDVSGFISISESNSCKFTAPGLYIGTSIVLSLQLLITLLLTMALLSPNLMDLIYSVPSINMERIYQIMDNLMIGKCIERFKSVYSTAINGISGFFRKYCLSNFISELYQKLHSNFMATKSLFISGINKSIHIFKNLNEKFQAIIENIGKLSHQIVYQLNSCGHKLCEIGRKGLNKAKSIGSKIREGSVGFNIESIPLLPK